jgi:hypothetical protein
MNLNMRASAVLIWLYDSENPTLESFGPGNVSSPPQPNPEAWWWFAEAVKHAVEAPREHKKVPWIKTGGTILGPNQILQTYSALRAASKF